MESKGYSRSKNRKKVDTGSQTGLPGALYFEATPVNTIRSPSYSSEGKSDRGKDTYNHL